MVEKTRPWNKKIVGRRDNGLIMGEIPTPPDQITTKEILEQRASFEKIDPTIISSQIVKGSLVGTNKGYLFLSIAFGKISVDEKIIMAISPQSPLGIKLMGLRVNDSAQINGTNYFIESIN